MPERKDRQVITNLEPTFYLLAINECARMNCSISAYVRTTIIKDLCARGLLNAEILLQALMDESPWNTKESDESHT